MKKKVLLSTACAVTAIMLSYVSVAGAVSPAPQSERLAENLPAGYVATPFGYMSAHCIYAIGKNDLLTADGIRRVGGNVQKLKPCAYPRYLNDGTKLSIANDGFPSDAVPQPLNWQFGVEYTPHLLPGTDIANPVALKSLSVTLVVPAEPEQDIGTTPHLYLFPGISDSIDGYPEYLTPVIGWNQYVPDDAEEDGGYQPGWSYELWRFIGNGSGIQDALVQSLHYSLESGDHVGITIRHCNKGETGCDASRPWTVNASSSNYNRWNDQQAVELLGDGNMSGVVTQYGGVFAINSAGGCSSLPNQPVVTFGTETTFADANYQWKWSPEYWHSLAGNPGNCENYYANIQPMTQNYSYINLNFNMPR